MKNIAILISILIYVLCLRIQTLGYSVLSHDESTYLVISKFLLHGKSLYSDLWDIKPFGIFFIASSVLQIFSENIVSLRIFGVFCISVSCYFCSNIVSKILKTKNIFIYIITTVVLSYLMIKKHNSLGVNTEIVFSTLNVMALALYLDYFEGKKIKYLLISGIALGLSLTIKPIMIFNFFAISIFHLFSSEKKHKAIKEIFYFGVFFSIPYILGFLYFYNTDHFNEYYETTFRVPLRYGAKLAILEIITYIKTIHKTFPVVFAFFYLSIFKFRQNKYIYLLLLVYLAEFAACIIPGTYLAHYHIQLFPTLSIVAALGINTIQNKKLMYSILVVFIISTGEMVFRQHGRYIKSTDQVRVLENEIRKNLRENDEIFIATGGLQILYFLLEKTPPTKYVHPSLLYNKNHIKAIGFDSAQEYENILAKKPRYIIAKSSNTKMFKEKLNLCYRNDFSIDEINVYILNDSPNCQ